MKGTFSTYVFIDDHKGEDLAVDFMIDGSIFKLRLSGEEKIEKCTRKQDSLFGAKGPIYSIIYQAWGSVYFSQKIRISTEEPIEMLRGFWERLIELGFERIEV